MKRKPVTFQLALLAVQLTPVSGWNLVFPQAMEKLSEAWSLRILVTLCIMAFWDYWCRRNQPPSQSISAVPAVSPVLHYQPMKKPLLVPNPLLDQLDQQRQTSQEEKMTDVTLTKHDTAIDQSEDRNKGQASKSKPMKVTTTSRPTSARAASVVAPSLSANAAAAPAARISAKTNHHPGMQHFGHWYEVETSLYRIYTLGRQDGVEVVPPYIPHSYRGKVPLHLHVTNQTNTVISVYWVDYKGKHILKGTMKPNQVWVQTTWIDHPWVFEGLDENENSTPYLYYIPYRVIPTLPECPTVNPDDPHTGQHKFAIIPSPSNSPSSYVGVQDSVFPFPADVHFATPVLAITWTLQHMSRQGWVWNDPTIDLLQKYLANIVESPENSKYRQLRVRNSKFSSIWNSALQGLLLAVGFVEVQGYAELGCSEKPLSRDRIQELVLLSYMLTQWQAKEQKKADASLAPQPDGADGFGRAGYGRAGTIN